MVRQTLAKMFPNDPFIAGGFYSWLPSAGGDILQIDVFFPQISRYNARPLAVEVQGDQHRKRSWWAAGKEAFERLQENDKLKKAHLSSRKIPLLEIWPEDKIDEQTLLDKIEKLFGLRT